MQNMSELIELIFKDKENNVNLWESLNYILQNNKEEINNFCNIIKSKINSKDKSNILLALNILDFAVDFGHELLWQKIDSNDFLSCIINIIKKNQDPDLQSVCLYLINKLAEKFKAFPSLQNCVNLQKNLKRSQIKFPQSIKHSYVDILHNDKTNVKNTNNLNNNINNNFNINKTYFNPTHKIVNTEINLTRKSRIASNPENYLNNISLKLNQNNYHKKYTRLINKLVELAKLIQEMNILINKNINRQNNEPLKNLYEKLNLGKNKVVISIQDPKFEDEKLMSITLAIVEDINMTINRYEKSIKGENPGPFYSSFSRDNNPYFYKNKIDINKTFNFGANNKNKINELDLGESVKTVYLNKGDNNIMENSLNVMFGKVEKSEVIDTNKSQGQNNNESMNFFNSMSHVSNNGDFNNNENMSDKKFNILNNSNVMIIGNKIINNNINNNKYFNNNSLVNKNFVGNRGSKGIFNNFLLNNNKEKIQNNNINNYNNLYNTQIISTNNINNNNNIQYNFSNNNSKNISKTQYFTNHPNLNNKK